MNKILLTFIIIIVMLLGIYMGHSDVSKLNGNETAINEIKISTLKNTIFWGLLTSIYLILLKYFNKISMKDFLIFNFLIFVALSYLIFLTI